MSEVRRVAASNRRKRRLQGVSGVFGAALLLSLGCPLYEEECDDRNDCALGYRCDRFSQRCEPDDLQFGCRRPEQCAVGETCTPEAVCRPGSCEYHGCVSGYRCEIAGGVHSCLERSLDASTTTPMDGGGAGGSGPMPAPADAGNAEADAASDAGDAAADSSG